MNHSCQVVESQFFHSFFPGRWPGVGQVSRARLEGGTCLVLANVRGRQVIVCRLLMIIIYLMIFISLQLIPVKSIQNNNVNSIHTYVFFHFNVGHQRLMGGKSGQAAVAWEHLCAACSSKRSRQSLGQCGAMALDLEMKNIENWDGDAPIAIFSS